jgi:hypothetical protein
MKRRLPTVIAMRPSGEVRRGGHAPLNIETISRLKPEVCDLVHGRRVAEVQDNLAGPAMHTPRPSLVTSGGSGLIRRPSGLVSRDIDEDVQDHVRALADTEAFQRSRRERKKVEMRFAHMKRILKLDRLRLRGLSGARDEVLLTATAQNLRRLAKLLCRPPPAVGVACLA